MRASRVMGVVASLALVSTTLLSLPAQAEEPPPLPSPFTQRSTAEPLTKGSLTAKAARSAAALETSGSPLDMPESYPFQPKLKVYPDADPDAADSGELIGYDDIAPTLSALMRSSDRVSTQIVGESTQGRQLYLVTVTAPETEEQTAQQAAWRDAIREDPEAADADDALKQGYKTPVWISSNIHGNEWEGTDAALQYIEELATASWNDVKGLLRGHRLYFSLTLNPDGRTIGQRASALNLDTNRDMITNTTPESTSFIKTAQAVQALYAADFHGYTGVLQVEPCGPPHGDDYEYDLFIPHAYALSLQVEQDVVEAEIPGNTYYNVDTGRVVDENTGPETSHIKIPYRDTPSGWDDFPPIFTAQYAALSGTVTSTIELPKSRPSGSTQSPQNAVINTAVALRTMQSLVDYVEQNDDAMLADQIEFFRRANAGAEKVSLTTENIADLPGPQEWKGEWDATDDQNEVSYPRGFVIPVGADQRSVSDARFLVDRLLMHGVDVGRLDTAATIDGTAYPAGSYVVDMHQPHRNLAHALLALGTDISMKLPSMYDISAWSLSYLWGASVDAVGETGVGTLPSTARVTSAATDAAAPAAGSYLTFDLAGVNDYRTLNAILEEEVPVSQLADGSAIVGADAGSRKALVAAADEFGVDIAKATKAEVDELREGDAQGLEDLTLGYTGNQDDLLSLSQLGFDDLVAVNAATITADPTVLDDLDALWLGSTLSFNAGQTAGQEAVQAFVDGGGSLVGRGTGAFNTAESFGLVSGDAVAGNGSGNGIVALDTAADGVLAPYAQSSAFIYPAAWFTGLGDEVTVEQTYDATQPLLAGHWRRGTDRGTGEELPNGPQDAAGHPATVSATAESGAKAFVFGASVFFRTHPKGGQSQAARALFWAAADGDGVEAPVSTATTLSVAKSATYPKAVKATVRVSAAGSADTPEGRVELREGSKVVAKGTLAGNGTAKLTAKGLKPGNHRLVAVYVPSSSGFESSKSSPATVRIAKASSKTKVKAKAQAKKVRVSVTVRSAASPTGKVQIKAGSKTRVVKVRNGKATVTVRLPRGKHKVVATYRGSALVKGSTARTTVRVR